ncbi:MAG TPA: M56 family metallopeptidase [Candidatus Angelobacter sp.]|nr:M56 family metallopeptidase [Candidatus Angelobacter sp.]
MAPYSLYLAGVLLTFIVKVAAAFLLCLCLARLLRSPRHRFLTWLGFLLGVGVCWTALLVDETVAVFSRAGASVAYIAQTTSASGEHLSVPLSWSLWIGRAVLAFGLIYIAVVISLLSRRLLQHLRLRSWLKHARPASPELEGVFQGLCRDFNIRRCRLLILPNVTSPATVYWWSPRVILPEICEELVASPQLGNILRHELIHTLRCDYLWAMLGDVLCAVLFFHPAVREARKRLMMQRELACDLSVVESHPEQRADYAESLAQFVRLLMLRPSPALGVDFASSSSFLGTRIRHILTEPRQVPGWKKLISDAAFLLFIVIFGSVSPALSVSFNFSQQPPSQSVATPPSTRTTPLDFNVVSPRRRHNRVTLPTEYQQIITMSSLPNGARRH